jgi:hypothetical protein
LLEKQRNIEQREEIKEENQHQEVERKALALAQREEQQK